MRATSFHRPRPNFFIIGAMKSGTTSLHQYLARHPGAFMSEPKEPGYFVEQLNWSQGEAWYLQLFETAGEARIIGESSTHYTKLPTYDGVAERLVDFNPEARFVYLMRDPLERIVSHYWHNVRNLFLEAERRDFATAVAVDPEYLAFSDYAMQLEPYLRLFGPERIYCVTFEALVANPAGVTRAVCDWLGLEGDLPAQSFDQRWNARPESIRQASGFGLLNRFAHSKPWARLSPFVPKPFKRLAGALASRPVTPSPRASAAVIDTLRPQVRERVSALSSLLGRSFPEWTTVGYQTPVSV